MTLLSKRLLTVAGLVLALAALFMFGFGGPATTIGSETDVTPQPGQAYGLLITVENTNPGTATGVHVEVVVLDVLGDAVPGAACHFSIDSQPGNDASVPNGDVYTDAAGRAGVTLNTGTTPGTVVVKADCDGRPAWIATSVGGESSNGNASPPASLPDAGGGYMETARSHRMLFVTLLAGLGVTLAGAGLMAGRLGQRRPQS